MEPALVVLDIDGVLTTHDRLRQARAVGSTSSSILAAALFPRPLQLLSEFCRRHRASVVVSSSWRKRLPHPGVQQVFRRFGAEMDVLGDTPIKRGGIFIRESEVLEWLEPRALRPCRLVVFDDRPEPFRRLRSFYVQPPFGGVLTPENIASAEAIYSEFRWPRDLQPDDLR